MCGRVIQSSGPLRLAIVEGLDVSDRRMGNVRPRYNAAPSEELLVIRENHKTGERSLDLIKWGLIPHWCQDPKGGRKPINAKAESVSRLPTFRDAYAQRRCIVPVDGFFEWRAIKGARAKQPYAIAMKDGSPFGLAGLWVAQPEYGRMGTNLRHHHCRLERAGGSNTRPYARDPQPRWVRPLARSRTRSARPPHNLSVRANDDVAHLHAGEQAGER
jgi:putative SOS response-associated peptidase YedK